MNFPDNFDNAAFNSIFGSRETDADRTYDIATSQVQAAVNKAFAETGGDNPMAATLRWMTIGEALKLATGQLEQHASLSDKDRETIRGEEEAAKDYNIDCDHAAVSQNMGTILYVYRRAIDRKGE